MNLGLAFVAILISTAISLESAPLSVETPVITLEHLAKGKVEGSESSLLDLTPSIPPAPQALFLQSRGQARQPWNAQLRSFLQQPVPTGSVALFKITLKTIETSDESGTGSFTVSMSPGDRHVKLGDFSYRIPKKETTLWIPIVIQETCSSGIQIKVQICRFAQKLELTGFDMTLLPPGTDVKKLPITRVTYGGSDPNAAWRKPAAERIEKLRKGDFQIQLLDSSQKPVSNATVSARLIQHAYAFGSAVTAAKITEPTTSNDFYRQTIKEQFNTVVFENDLKWKHWEKGREQTLKAIEWCRLNQIQIRGHVLVWPKFERFPPEIQALRSQPTELRLAVDRHIEEMVNLTRETILDWDVLNEPFDNHDLMDLWGNSCMISWFTNTQRLNPEARLYINDFANFLNGGADTEHKRHYFETIRYLKENKAPLHGIGMQSHFGADLPSIDQVKAELDRFAELQLPIRITEFDIDTTDEELQAQFLRDFMTITFSHPSVNGFIMWGFWEGSHWRPNAALWRKDGTPKPAALEWMRLLHEEWFTQVTAQSSAQGVVNFRGFYGIYELTVNRDGKISTHRISLPSSSRVSITLSSSVSDKNLPPK